MVPKLLPSETPSASHKKMAEEELNPFLKKLEMKMLSFYNALEDLDALVSHFPTFFEFMSVISIAYLTYSPTISSIHSVGPHSHTKPSIMKTRSLSTKPPSIPKKLIKATSTQVVDLISEEPQSHASTPITEENPFSTFVVSPISLNPLPQITSTSTAILEIPPSRSILSFEIEMGIASII